MNETFPRRSLLTTLGAAALGTAACDNKPISTSDAAPEAGIGGVPRVIGKPTVPRLNLICHGMMLFWQDRSDQGRSLIHIKIPNTLQNNVQTHELRLSLHVGGLPSLIEDSLNAGRKRYKLSLSYAKPRFERCDGNFDVVLHSYLNNELEPVDDAANVRCTISIPAPNAVQRFRTFSFPKNKPAYKNDDTASKFTVQPATMAGVHVMTYEGVKDVRLIDQDNNNTEIFVPQLPVLNIHLYSEQVKYTGSHLHHFNGLLKYTGKEKLDLVVNNDKPNLTPLENEDLPADLSVFDILGLAEIPDVTPRLVDPAECLQGWGS